MSYEDVLLANTLPDLLKLSQCTVLGFLSDEGEPVIARNLDYFNAAVLSGSSVVLNTSPDKGYRHTSIGFPLLVGVYSGMNEAGLTIAALEVYGGPADDLHGASPCGIVYRQVLETCGTVDEAVETLRRYRIVSQQNVLLADEKRVVVVEYDRGHVSLAPSSQGVVFAINSFNGDEHFKADRRLRVFQDTAGHLNSTGDLQAFLRATALPGMNVQSMIFYPRRRAFSLASGGLPAAAGAFSDHILPFWTKGGAGSATPSRAPQ